MEKENSISFIINGEPFGKKRPRAVSRGGFARVHNDPENERYELKVINAFQNKYGNGIETYFDKDDYIFGEIIAYYSIPKSFSKKKMGLAMINEIRPTKKPDLDNVAKSVLDALNNIAYNDDSQIIDLRIAKFYGDNPRVEVSLSRTYNERKDKKV